MTVATIVQARMSSTRLPGKVAIDIAGRPMIAHVVERAKAIDGVDDVIVATSELPADDPIAAICREHGWPCFRGSEEDVLDRYYRAAREAQADHVVRITSDCPLHCPIEAARVIETHLRLGVDYTHNLTAWGSGMPLGTGTEIFRFTALERSWREGRAPHHREHVDEYVYERRDLFSVDLVLAPEPLRRPQYRLTVDTENDLRLVREIYARLGGRGELIELVQVVQLLDETPELVAINAP